MPIALVIERFVLSQMAAIYRIVKVFAGITKGKFGSSSEFRPAFFGSHSWSCAQESQFTVNVSLMPKYSMCLACFRKSACRNLAGRFTAAGKFTLTQIFLIKLF